MPKKTEKIMRSIAAGLLCLTLLLTPTLPLVAADETGAAEEVGFFRYATGNGDSDITELYRYRDSFFHGSAYTYNEGLATLSLSLAISAGGSTETDFSNKSRNVTDFLGSMGFTDVKVNDAFKKEPTEHSIGVAVGHKTLSTSEGNVTLLAVVPRGAGYGKEWADNFTVGTSGLHEGFRISADTVADFVRDYVKSCGISGRVKLWITGYSRGGAVANLLGGRLVREPSCLGITVNAADLYVYTFAAPRGVPVSQKPKADGYGNIFNVILEYDLVPMVAPAAWTFERYGVDRVLGAADIDKKERMLRHLQDINGMIYAEFTDPDKGDDPHRFKEHRFVLGDEFKIVENPADVVGITQAEFLAERIDIIATEAFGERKNYVDFQPILEELIPFYMTRSGKERLAMTEAVKNNKTALSEAVVFTYAYHAFDLFAKRSLTAGEIYSQLLELEAFAKKTSSSLYDSLVSNSNYKLLRSGLQAIVNGIPGAAFLDFRALSSLTAVALRSLSAGKLRTLLITALSATSADTAFISRMTEDHVTELLCDLVSEGLFGGKDENTTGIFSENSVQLTTAATFLGNMSRVTKAHYYEVMLAWVRTEDPAFATKAPAALTVTGELSKTYDSKAVAKPTVKTDSTSPVTVEFKKKGAEDSTYTATAPVHAGDYTMRVTVKEGRFFGETAVLTDFTIAKALIFVTANSYTKTFGDKNASFTYSVKGLPDGMTYEPKLTRKAGEDAGEYPITLQNEESPSPDYEIRFTGGTYTIEPKDITGASVILGDAPTENGKEQTQEIRSVVLDGFPVTYTVTGNTATAAGTYTMHITGNGNFKGTVEAEYRILKEGEVPPPTKPVETHPAESTAEGGKASETTASSASETTVPQGTEPSGSPTILWIAIPLVLTAGAAGAILFYAKKKSG